MSDTPDSIEREVEARRASVESTLDALKGRMTLDQMVDDVTQFVGLGDPRATLRSAGEQLRANPVALGVIGLGLALLVVGAGNVGKKSSLRTSGSGRSYAPYGGSQTDWSERERMGYVESGRTGAYRSSSYDTDYDGSRSGGVLSKVKGAVAGVAGAASSAASAVAGAASSAAGAVTGAAYSAADSVSGVAQSASGSLGGAASTFADRAGSYRSAAGERFNHLGERISYATDAGGHRLDDIRHRASTQLEQNPLLIGAIALAAGAVIGAALPRTRVENRYFGEQRDHLMDEARAASGELRERAVDAAKSTYRAAVDAARDEGLVPSGDQTLASKLEAVAAAAVIEAKHQAEPILGEAEDTLASTGASGSGSMSKGSTKSASTAGSGLSGDSTFKRT